MSKLYHVSFPGLGLEFEVDPVAFMIGNFSVYWYGILIAIGFSLAMWYGMTVVKKRGIDSDKYLNVILVGMVTAIIGARLYYVAFSWDDFKNAPLTILNIHEGGLAIYGGIIGALLGGLITAKLQKMELLKVLDVAAMGFLIGQCIGRWGNFMNQEAFGTPTDLPWGMASERTGFVTVHPCFLYESLWCLLGFLLLHFYSKRKDRFDGEIFFMYLAWYGFERTLVEALRTDSLYLPFADIRVSQLLSCVIFLVSVGVLIAGDLKRRKNKTADNTEEIDNIAEEQT